MTIQPRRERSHTDLPGKRTDQPPGNPTLRRNPHLSAPVTSRVIHPTTQHDTQHLTHHPFRHHPLTRKRIHPRFANVTAITARSRILTNTEHRRT